MKCFGEEGGSIAHWLAYLLLCQAAAGLNHCSGIFLDKILNVTELIDSSALLRVRVVGAKKLNS